MIRTEVLPDGCVRTYSDAGYYIHGGSPAGDYTEAVDPASASRTYTETDIPIPGEAAVGTDEYYAAAGRILLGEDPEEEGENDS